MRDIVLKYPIWQEPYRAAVIETNPRLLKRRALMRALLEDILHDGQCGEGNE
jgi:hypothetical protein